MHKFALNVVTKDPVRDNFKPTKAEMLIRLAVHLLDDASNEIDVILMADPDLSVYLIAGVQDEMDDDEKIVNGKSVFTPRPRGTVEYSVCDGLPGHRSYSNDYFCLTEAIKGFKEVVEVGGWEKWGSNQMRRLVS